ncbi:MAG: GtrA family protein [Desulfobulbaceae bacterium]|jgi:putative flippase GtrA|nr:GtrA family protein [Desulfobulbaceae bacterium]
MLNTAPDMHDEPNRRTILFQFVKFLINGGLLGLVAVAAQALLYRLCGDGSFAYALASALTYGPLILINFIIQQSWIFKRSGCLWRFVVINLLMMLLVSLLSSLCKLAIDLIFWSPWGARYGFLVASLLGAIPSFLAQKRFVFTVRNL